MATVLTTFSRAIVHRGTPRERVVSGLAVYVAVSPNACNLHHDAVAALPHTTYAPCIPTLASSCRFTAVAD
jgi:hypothetical protein